MAVGLKRDRGFKKYLLNEQMIIYTEIVVYILIWFIILVLVIRKSRKNKDINSGFAVIYIVNLFLIYGFAALLYLLPWHRYVNGKCMLYGLREATYGAGAFAVGNLILAPFLISLFFTPRKNPGGVDKTKQDFSSPLPKRYFLIGIISYFILPHFTFGLPTVTSLTAAGHQLIVAGLCLICWQAWGEGDKKRFKRWLFISFLLPLISITLYGFLGVGMTMTLVIFLFVARFFRPSFKTLIICVLLVYIGLSLYLTYMRDRGVLRDAAWGGAPISKRVELLKASITQPVWFNIFDLEQLELIDGRMNQNILVGAAVEYIGSGRVDYADGKTIIDSIVALIPRVFWEEKPIFAGSGNIVSEYTGIEFAGETSVGVGQVMEFYINFGRVGVIIGFLILGIIVAIIDIMAGYYLGEHNLKKFILWFLPGLASLSCGAFVEMTSSTGAAIFLVYLITSRNLLIVLLILFSLIQVTKRLVLRFLPL